MPRLLKVESVVTNFPHTRRPATRKPINLDQDHESIAKDIALKYRGDLLIWDYEKETNSLFVMLTNHRKFRLYFS
jgi:hypothetical protein